MATTKLQKNNTMDKNSVKNEQELIFQQTDILSLTLNEYYTTTTENFDNHLTSDLVAIDQQTLSKQAAKKVVHVLDIVRQLSGIKSFARVESINHVPTAAGLASSASAFAALAGAASVAAGLNLSSRDLSRLARRGSGSATRSIYGGLVEWQKGTDDASSFAQPILENVDFPIEMLAVLVDTKKKKVSSRSGMQSSVETSPYYDAWRQAVEDLRNQGVNCYYTMDDGPNVKVIYDRGNRNKIVEELSNIVGPERLVVSQPGPGIKIWNE